MKACILISLLFSSSAFALCACERVSLSLGIANSTNIFRATVMSVSKGEIHLKQVKVFKGKFLEKIKTGVSSCPPEFKIGDENVFYLTDAKIESQCDHYFPVSNKAMYQQFIKLL